MSRRSGWAYGARIPAESLWLTILGSAYEVPELHATKEAAEAALSESGLRAAEHLRLEVAHVTERWHGGVSGRGVAYRITGISGGAS